MSNGKRWAYGGAIVGGGVSVLANIAHSFVPAQPDGMPDAVWRALPNAAPQPGAVLLAAFWPSALLLAIEVLARVEWPRQLRWTLVRWGGVIPVAAVAAIVSYRHLSGLLHWYGEDPITVKIGPAAVDGLMVVSTGALLALAGLAVGSVGSVPDRAIGSDAPIGSDGLVGSDGLADERPSIPVQSDGSEPIAAEPIGSDGLDGSPDPDGSPVDVPAALHAVPSQSDGPMARADDLAKARAAVRAGTLKRPVTADAVRDTLKIGLKHARVVRDIINSEPDKEAV